MAEAHSLNQIQGWLSDPGVEHEGRASLVSDI